MEIQRWGNESRARFGKCVQDANEKSSSGVQGDHPSLLAPTEDGFVSLGVVAVVVLVLEQQHQQGCPAWFCHHEEKKNGDMEHPSNTSSLDRSKARRVWLFSKTQGSLCDGSFGHHPANKQLLPCDRCQTNIDQDTSSPSITYHTIL